MVRQYGFLLLALALSGPAAAQQTNPALKLQPSFDDPALAADLARLNSIHSSSALLESRLSATGSGDCPLDEDLRWRLALSLTQEDHERSMSLLAEAMRPRVVGIDAALVAGECVDGVPEGAFTAVTRFETRQSVAGMTTTTLDRRRVSGMMQDGVLHGEMVSSGRSSSDTDTLGRLNDAISHVITHYEHGEQAGTGMSLSFIHDAQGSLTQVVVAVSEVEAPGRVRTRTYSGNMLASEMTLVDGRTHGWVISHPVEYVRGHRSELTRVCYQHGQMAGDAACAAEAAAPAGATLHPRPTLRRGQERELMEALQRITQEVIPGDLRQYEAVESLCELDTDALWHIALHHPGARARMEGRIARMEAKVVEGACVNGRPEGPFTMLLLLETRDQGAAAASRTVSRLSADMRAGRKEGRWSSARTVIEDLATGLETQTYTVVEYSGDRPASPRITFNGMYTVVERPAREPSVDEVEVYVGDYRTQGYRAVHGQRDGTSTSYPRGRRPVHRCYRNGVMVSEGRCRGS